MDSDPFYHRLLAHSDEKPWEAFVAARALGSGHRPCHVLEPGQHPWALTRADVLAWPGMDSWTSPNPSGGFVSTGQVLGAPCRADP